MSNFVGEKFKGARPTISDVARLSGVAKATVSKALDPTGRYGLSGPLRQRITEVADQLGYRANSGGRSSMARVRLVGLLANPGCYLPSDVSARMTNSINAALLSRGYRAVDIPLLEGFDWETLLDEPKLGAWLVSCPQDGIVEKLLAKLGPRTVLINAGSDIAASRILADEAGAARLLVGHLLELGHRNIAFCQDAAAPGSGALVDRREQVEMSVVAAGGSCRIISSPKELLEGWDSSRAAATAVTAVICATFSVAMRLLHGCTKQGIRVPADLSIASFDDADAAQYFSPALTATRMAAEEMGREAALLLVDQLENQQSTLPRKIVMAQTLIVRESTAAVRQEK
jgi:LacI family transcriptional regulator